ncbi:RNA methyltransferase [Patescibacteria group bacterium]|nr:RNA methyltransferase [Patescibacteria group bacterium]
MKELAVVLHDIRSLHNVGSIFRTADAAGVSKLYLCGITGGPLDRFGNVRKDVAKVALGAERTVPWEKMARTQDAIKKLKKEGYRVVALEQGPGSVAYDRMKAGGKTALVLGNEVSGLPKAVLKAADATMEIPMLGKKESLNVSVAFGIAVFALVYNK